MTKTYECMFLLDNEVVRSGWAQAKGRVGALVEKHGGKVETARRWGERRLAYPIRHKNRATYLLAYLTFEAERVAGFRGDLDISETVLRYLILGAEAVPAEERELAAAEDGADFVVPEPPADDVVDEAPRASSDDDDDDDSSSGDDDDDDGRRSRRRKVTVGAGDED